MTTLELKRTGTEKALGALNGNGNGANAQSLTVDGLVYCPTHGAVKSWHGHCAKCVDEGYRDWDATRIAKDLIPSWVGINPHGRQVIVARVKDALDAVQTISRYKDSDAIVLIVWDRLVTALDRGHVGPSWTLPQPDAEEEEQIECARCCQLFTPVWGEEQLCEQYYLTEYGPPHCILKGGSKNDKATRVGLRDVGHSV